MCITNVRDTENTPTHTETFVYTQQEGNMTFQPQFALKGKKLIKNHSLVRPVFCIAPWHLGLLSVPVWALWRQREIRIQTYCIAHAVYPISDAKHIREWLTVAIYRKSQYSFVAFDFESEGNFFMYVLVCMRVDAVHHTFVRDVSLLAMKDVSSHWKKEYAEKSKPLLAKL